VLSIRRRSSDSFQPLRETLGQIYYPALRSPRRSGPYPYPAGWLCGRFRFDREGSSLTSDPFFARSMTTLLDHKVTLAYLAYLGFSDTSSTSGSSAPAPTANTLAALNVTPSRRHRQKGKQKRNVYLAYVLGAGGSGKTGILRTFIGRETMGVKPNSRYEPTKQINTVVNSVEVGGGEKYLVLQEFGSNYESETLRNSKKLRLADVLVFVYDSSDTNSFSYISNLRVSEILYRCSTLITHDNVCQQQYRVDDMPSIFVATKSDLDLVFQVRPTRYHV
jgi:mitochondrial Rho GTPase 1